MKEQGENGMELLSHWSGSLMEPKKTMPQSTSNALQCMDRFADQTIPGLLGIYEWTEFRRLDMSIE